VVRAALDQLNRAADWNEFDAESRRLAISWLRGGGVLPLRKAVDALSSDFRDVLPAASLTDIEETVETLEVITHRLART
jgi:hypothetical protein